MANQHERDFVMDFKDSESESFLPKPVSLVLGQRRNIFNKFAVLGWILAIILLATNFYEWTYPRKPTDLECTRQLNAWCKYLGMMRMCIL
jgi:hypothetical protein